ncbi:MAG: phenylacetate--CoA ligase family protein, partial [Candidatus Zixiibacteriota bacterium]
MKLVRLILKAPRAIQQPLRYAVGLIPPPIRYGRAFSETTALLDRQEYWDRDQLLEYQSDCLRTLVHHAYENVPYYRETWDRLGIIPTDIRTVHDIRKLPFLTKETIQTRTRDLIARNFAPSKLVYSTTGGSTGIPLGFYEEAGVTQALERAFIAKQWQRVGYEVGDKTAVFRGTVVAGSDADRLWEYNPMERSLAFSSYHLTEDRIPRMLEKLRSFSPLFIQAYPSSIYQIAEFMR